METASEANNPREIRRVIYSWREAVGHIIMVCLVAYCVLGVIQYFGDRSSALPSASSHDAGLSFRDSGSVNGALGSAEYLVPLAQINDTFSIHLSSPTARFDEVVFDNLPFHEPSLRRLSPHTTIPLKLSDCIMVNCSLPTLVVLTMRNHSFTYRVELIKFMAEKKVAQRKLLGRNASLNDKVDPNDVDEFAGNKGQARYIPYLQPVLTLSPVIDVTTPLPMSYRSFTPLLEDEGVYGPAIYVNDFWTTRDHLVEMNSSMAHNLMNVTVSITPIAPWKVILYTQLDQSWQQQREMGFIGVDETDEMKRIFLDNNPYFLAITALVSLLHMVFEYLAFSNDVRFWRGRENFKGLSLRSVVMNCYFQLIIFLYLHDTKETSWTILLPAGVGVLTEFWKLSRVILIRRICSDAVTSPGVGNVAPSSKLWRVGGYEVSFKDSYDSCTRRYDQVAMRYLVLVMMPFLIGYSIYSMVYEPHKSWYSYLVTTQVRFIYFFGFAMMTPQIFINYKMKSVGQLPWRTFVYKTLNTIIDDLFAFVIKMPWLHRIACFRDDVVFLILLYQRFIYPVDIRRGADDEEKDDEEAQKAVTNTSPLTAAARKRQ